MENNKIYHGDCMDYFKIFLNDSVDFTITDIPYEKVNRKSNGLRNLDKGKADIMNYDLEVFLQNILRITRNSIVIFCGKEQFSRIYGFFAKEKGTVRPIIWEKSNPSPMNGEYVYLSGVEMGVWFKKRGGKIFNAHCKNTVFKFPNGKSKIHPTEKNHKLLQRLILDNTNENDIVFDPNAGSGSHLLVARNLHRRFIGIEIDKDWYNQSISRLKQKNLFQQ